MSFYLFIADTVQYLKYLFRTSMFDSVAPLQMVMSADPAIWMAEKVKACGYILNLLSQIWKQQAEIPHIYARNV